MSGWDSRVCHGERERLVNTHMLLQLINRLSTLLSVVWLIRMMAAIYLKAAAKFLQLGSASAWIDDENG